VFSWLYFILFFYGFILYCSGLLFFYLLTFFSFQGENVVFVVFCRRCDGRGEKRGWGEVVVSG